jgi:cell wall-associated NlpC family hydrolase
MNRMARIATALLGVVAAFAIAVPAQAAPHDARTFTAFAATTIPAMDAARVTASLPLDTVFGSPANFSPSQLTVTADWVDGTACIPSLTTWNITNATSLTQQVTGPGVNWTIPSDTTWGICVGTNHEGHIDKLLLASNPAAALYVTVLGNVPTGQAIVNAAAAEVGVTYCWDGGSPVKPYGPSHGSGNYMGYAPLCTKTKTKGFDCTGLTLFAVYHVTHVLLPHGQGQQLGGGAGTLITNPAISQLQIGDLLLFGQSTTYYEHTAIYAGNGMMWDANSALYPYPDGVHERTVLWETTGSSPNALVGAVRFP